MALSTEFQKSLLSILRRIDLQQPGHFAATIDLQQMTSNTAMKKRVSMLNTTMRFLIRVVPKNFSDKPLETGASSFSTDSLFYYLSRCSICSVVSRFSAGWSMLS